jgi:hypothetical protein
MMKATYRSGRVLEFNIIEILHQCCNMIKKKQQQQIGDHALLQKKKRQIGDHVQHGFGLSTPGGAERMMCAARRKNDAKLVRTLTCIKEMNIELWKLFFS